MTRRLPGAPGDSSSSDIETGMVEDISCNMAGSPGGEPGIWYSL